MILVTADLHLHEWQSWSTILPSGRNSRLQHGVSVMEHMLSRLKSGDSMLFLGDFFDNRRSISVNVLHAAAEILEKIPSGVEMVLMCGNHDQHLQDGSINSLSIFKGNRNIRVIDEPSTVHLLDGTQVCLIPYSDDFVAVRHHIKTMAKSHPGTILGLHHTILGSVMNGGQRADWGLSGEDLLESEFSHVISGHFHSPQRHYVGSPYQIDRGETGYSKRFLEISDGKTTSVPLNLAPEFLDVDFSAECEREGLIHGSPRFITLRHPIQDTEAARKMAERINGMGHSMVNLLPVRQDAQPGLLESDDITDIGPAGQEVSIARWLKSRGKSHLYETAVKRMNT